MINTELNMQGRVGRSCAALEDQMRALISAAPCKLVRQGDGPQVPTKGPAWVTTGPFGGVQMRKSPLIQLTE